MKATYERHELEAHRIRTVEGIRPHLCDAARGHGRAKHQECMACETGCAYGDRLLELLGIEVPKHETSDMKEFMRSGQALPTLHQRIRHQHRK